MDKEKRYYILEMRYELNGFLPDEAEYDRPGKKAEPYVSVGNGK